MRKNPEKAGIFSFLDLTKIDAGFIITTVSNEILSFRRLTWVE